jgi:hypothetical protein
VRQNVKYNLQNVGDAGLRFAGNRGMIALKKEGGASYRRHSVRAEGAKAFLFPRKLVKTNKNDKNRTEWPGLDAIQRGEPKWWKRS